MLKLFVAVFIGLFGFAYAQVGYPPAKIECEIISIAITDKNSTNKDEVVRNLLDVQKSLIIPLQKPIPEENAKYGYILIKMTPEYVDGLLEHKEGVIVGAYQGRTLVGYILLIEISEFKELYQDKAYGYIETPIDLTKLEVALSRPHVGYIEQIAVKPGYSKMGIGTMLINESKRLQPDGLVADVFLEPLTNEPSLCFFSRAGFDRLGVLYQHPRKNFPVEHRTAIFTWNVDL